MTATIAVGRFPEPIAFTPNGAHAYVGHYSGTPWVGAVAVVDTATDTVVADPHVGSQPFSIAVTPDGSHVYSANFVGSSVAVIDTATNTVSATISGSGIRTPTSIAISPDGAHAYLADFNADDVFVIDTATNSVTAAIPVAGGPVGFSLTPDGSRAYVADENANNVSVIDTTTNTVTATFAVGPFPIALAQAPVLPPTVTGLSPTHGPEAGGTIVTITGTNLTGTTQVMFGTTPATNVTIVNDTTVTATAPTHADGTVDVTVTNSTGTSATSSADQYTYDEPAPAITGLSPSQGPLAGGTSVTITGTDFLGASAVSFGATAASSFTVNSDTSITATAPAATAVGPVDVTVTTAAGTSATGAADRYTYTYPFTGFFAPVDNPPIVNMVHAGQAIPIQFSLGGNYGLNIIPAGYPTATHVNCTTGAPVNTGTLTDTSGNSGLQYDPTTNTYTYVWKTLKSWVGTCQVFTLGLNDTTTHVADFQFVN